MVSEHAMSGTEKRISSRAYRLAQYGLIALVSVNIVNLIVLYSGLALVDYPAEFVGGSFGPLAVGPVIINSSIAAFGATVVYGLVTRYSSRPNRTFTIIAGLTLVLSFGTFLAPDIADAPLSVFLTLGVMHVISAVVIVGVLLRVPHAEVPGEI